MNILAVFKIRSEALRFSEELKLRKIAYIIINTPSSLGIGCGLSVSFDKYFLDVAKEIIINSRYKSFYKMIDR